MRPEDIDKLTDAEIKERLMTMSPEAAAECRSLNRSATDLLALNLQEMENDEPAGDSDE